MSKIKRFTGLLLFCLAFASCKKHSGYGGNSSIIGKLEIQHYNSDFSIIKSVEPAADQYVYIVFGGDYGYGDRVKTNYDGSFEFSHLQKGDYTIYAYSTEPNSNNLSGFIPIQSNISISKNKQLVDAGTLIISDNSAIGYSKIKGKVKEIDTGNGNTQYYKENEKVFIIYDNQVNYSNSVYTNFNGEYEFDNLPQGHYTVYAYSKDVYNLYPSSNYAVKQEIDISSSNETVTLNDIIIYK